MLTEVVVLGGRSSLKEKFFGLGSLTDVGCVGASGSLDVGDHAAEVEVGNLRGRDRIHF